MFKDIQKLLISKDIKYLEMHDTNAGVKTFGAQTMYDWYVLQNKPTEHNKTTIKDYDGNISKIDLSSLKFIPNGMFDEIMSLVAKEGEENVEILYSRSAYGSDKKNMSKTETDEIMSLVAKEGEEKVEILHSYSAYESRKEYISKTETDEFKYPVIHSIKKAGLNLLYSNTDDNGMFGVPKVVFGRGQSGTFIDKNGEYGLSQVTRAIVDKKENLENINKAMNSPKFIELSKYCCLSSTSMFIDRYNKDILATFRKDFWKQFVK
jgi:hypothetical protein